MATFMHLLVKVVVSILFIFYANVVCEEDLYDVLGISRNANSEEIRRSYRRLAREWHPDKSSEPNAQEKFMKINSAYETLSDPEKRENYDRYGQSDPPRQHEREFQFFQDSGFMFFNGMPFQFQSNWHRQDFMTMNFYKKTVLPESYTKLFLLQILSDWCMNCAAVEEIWDYTARDLKSLGVGTGRINKNVDPQLARLLGIRKLPDFVAVVGGKLYHYTGSVSVENLKKFVSELFPKNLVAEVTSGTLKQFLHNLYQNRPRALLFTRKHEAPLLLKIVAFKYQHQVAVGFVKLHKPGNEEIREKFGAERYEPTFMLFKEDVLQPDIVLKSSELRHGAMDEVLSYNSYLYFPRLSSQEMFNKFCPEERLALRKSLCVILFTTSPPNIQHSLPSMSKDKTWRLKRVHFLYVNPSVQHSFDSSMKMNERTRSICRNELMSNKVAILWRVKRNEVKYIWFENGWCGPKDVSRLTDVLNKIQAGEMELEMTAVVEELYDEQSKDVGAKVADLLNEVVYYCVHYINWSGHLPTMSLALTFGFIFIISCLLPSVGEKGDEKRCSGEQVPSSTTSSDVFGLLELNSETQDELLHNARQSRLIVVLLSDAMSHLEAQRSPIIQMFAKITRSYQKENIFTFGWLSIPTYIAWCNEVMKIQTFGDINPGSVLALNGAKKYLSIFKIQKSPREEDTGSVFDDSDDEDNDSSAMVFREDKRTQRRTAEELARQFPSWIEKLLQGMVPRLKLDSWPRMVCDKDN